MRYGSDSPSLHISVAGYSIGSLGSPKTQARKYYFIGPVLLLVIPLHDVFDPAPRNGIAVPFKAPERATQELPGIEEDIALGSSESGCLVACELDRVRLELVSSS